MFLLRCRCWLKWGCVRLRASLSAPERTPVANDAQALFFSPRFLVFFRQQQNPKAVTSLWVEHEFIVILFASRLLAFLVWDVPNVLNLSFPSSADALLVFLLTDGYEIMYDIMYARYHSRKGGVMETILLWYLFCKRLRRVCQRSKNGWKTPQRRLQNRNRNKTWHKRFH
jgi:hypothetical protein